mmetsp:Transcript_39951/g.81810  ORF Transcript_39951/g.81810 Transcript_39951/m.81810 type:complete len:404 (-) Transcript_39951:15-1226(-)
MVDATTVDIMECCVTDRIITDDVSFRHWVEGRTPQEADTEKRQALHRHLFGNKNSLSQMDKKTWNIAQRVSIQECIDQFQVYDWLLPYFNEPQLFNTQMTFILEPATLKTMTEAFYSFDEPVMRELLGKVTSRAVRRELEDMTEGSRITVKSARRQFDNVKRVMALVQQELANKTSSGRGGHCTVLEIIMNHFMLPLELASQYQHIIFMSTNKIETFKNRLSTIDFKEWNSLAGVIMALWGCEYSLEFDVNFTEQMRSAKEGLSSRDSMSEYKKQVFHLLKSSMSDTEPHPTMASRDLAFRNKINALDRSFNGIVKGMLQIGSALQEWREVRDLFIDVQEKILDPLDKADMTLEQVITLLAAMDKVLRQRAKQPPWGAAWIKCVEGIKMVTITMYPKLFDRHA